MAYEYPSAAGTVRLIERRGRWLLHFAGQRIGGWRSPDQAAQAIARHQSGLELGSPSDRRARGHCGLAPSGRVSVAALHLLTGYMAEIADATFQRGTARRAA